MPSQTSNDEWVVDFAHREAIHDAEVFFDRLAVDYIGRSTATSYANHGEYAAAGVYLRAFESATRAHEIELRDRWAAESVVFNERIAAVSR